MEERGEDKHVSQAGNIITPQVKPNTSPEESSESSAGLLTALPCFFLKKLEEDEEEDEEEVNGRIKWTHWMA